MGIRLTKMKVNMSKVPVDNIGDNATKAKIKAMGIKLVDIKDALQNKIFLDHTGTFPYRSSRGMRYVMVGLECDTNYIMMESMQNRMAGKMIQAYGP